MLPFVTSQAIALSQARRNTGRQRTPNAAKAPRKSLLSRAFEALAESRLRHAEIALARYRRTPADLSKK